MSHWKKKITLRSLLSKGSLASRCANVSPVIHSIVKLAGEVGSFLYGGEGSPILGYANLWNIPPHISEVGDLSGIVPVNQPIHSIGSNGQYWLIGFTRYLYKFDGVNWELIDDEETTNIIFKAIKWNGLYWLIILYNYVLGKSYVAKYDGTIFDIVIEAFPERVIINDLAWSPTLNYWILAGRTYAVPEEGRAYIWDGTTLTDISETVKSEGDPVYSFNATEWHEDHFILGASRPEPWRSLVKFDGETATGIYVGWPVRVMKYFDGITVVVGHSGHFGRWDGQTFEDYGYVFNSGTEVYGIDAAEGLFLIAATKRVSNYETYYYPKLIAYDKEEDEIYEVTPPWGEGPRLYAIAYNPFVF